MKENKNRSISLIQAAVVLCFMFVTVIIHVLARQYGYHRDELFYIAIGDQWSFSNLDMLPLSPLYLRLFTFLFGHSLPIVHLASSLCAAGTLGLACMITREFGGRTYAILLTGILMLMSGFGAFGAVFTYDGPNFFLWVSALYAVMRVLKDGEPRWWILVGVFVGIGMLNKVSILFLALAIPCSLLLLPQRSFFRNRWLWIAGFVAVPFTVPFVLWQSSNGWYFVNTSSSYLNQVYRTSFPGFLWNQIFGTNPFALPVWLAGLLLLLLSSRWRTYRLFGFCYVFLFLIFYLLHMPFYFLLPLNAVLIPVGSIWFEQRFDTMNAGEWKRKIGQAAIPVLYFFGSLLFLPLAIPILPVENLVDYVSLIGVNGGIKTNNATENILPQHFADRFGWEEMVKQVSAVYHSSPLSEEGGVGIVTANYGEAGAVHLYRQKYGLPEPLSTHGWFYFQNLGTLQFKASYISIGIPLNKLKEMFATVEQKAVFSNRYCMPYENNEPICFCADPKHDLKKVWLIANQMDRQFRKYVDTAGVIKAIERFHALKKTDPSILLFTEGEINELGYEYLHRGMMDEAIALFALNVEEHPESSNTYDSLGEGYFSRGDYELAFESYKESFRRDSANSNAQAYIAKLRNIMGSHE